MSNFTNIKSIKRVLSKTGEVFYPHWYEEEECFVLADPKCGKVKHHKEHVVRVKTLDEVVDLVRKGFSLRMKGQENGSINLISPKSINISL